MKRMLLIINTKSGKTKSKSRFFHIIDRFDDNGFCVTVTVTRSPGHGIEIAKKGSISGNFDYIVCAGGDGTYNEVVNGVVSGNRDVFVGYIPAGSTNDFAASMNIEADILKAVDRVVSGKPHPIDIGLFNDRYFSYIATFGAFTSASYNTPQSFKNVFGHMAYVLSGIKDITAIQPYDVSVKTDKEDYNGEYIFGAVCNSTSVGGLLKLDADDVDMSDGLFEVILVRKPKNIVELNEIVWKSLASDFSGKMFEFIKVSEIEFLMPKGVSWSIDGEKIMGTEKTVIKNIHNALNFIR